MGRRRSKLSWFELIVRTASVLVKVIDWITRLLG